MATSIVLPRAWACKTPITANVSCAQRHPRPGVRNVQMRQHITPARRTLGDASRESVGARHGIQRRELGNNTRRTCAAAAASSDLGEQGVDMGALAKYVLATAFQWGAIIAALNVLQMANSALAASAVVPAWAPKAVVALFFGFISLKSRVFSILDNSRPTIYKDGKKMNVMDERKRPSWMPPPLAFPIVWTTIALLRTISSVIIWETLGQNLVVVPLAALTLHLSIGDTWNTINNVERRMGTAVIGVGFVWMSVVSAVYLYWTTSPLAGLVLAPSAVWLTVASVLVYSIWDLNGREPMLPMKAK